MALDRNSGRKQQTDNLFGVDLSRGIYSAAEQAFDTVLDILDPRERRINNSGLTPGGERSAASYQTANFADNDWRVRLSMPTGNGLFYHDNSNHVLSPLRRTSGLIWPYTPQVMITHSAAYAAAQPTHSNYAQHFYGSSTVDSIQISGEFSAQNQTEARYVIAALTFLRSVTKMFYGQDEIAGTPPPVLRLNGYGDHIFKNVPVVVVNFNADLSGDIDYINTHIGGNIDPESGINVSGGSTRVPTRTTITVQLQPVYSRKQMRDFGLKDFSAGRLIDKGFI